MFKAQSSLQLIFCIGLMASAWLASAQQTNLFTALELGQTNYPLLKAYRAEIEGTKHDVKTIYSDYLPKLTLHHQYTLGTSNSIAGSFYPNPAVISPSGGIRAENNYQATWGSFSSVMFEWNVFNFGKVSSQVNAAKANLLTNQAVYENELFQHQIKIIDAYLLALMASKVKTIQEQNVERAFHFQEMVNAGVRSGLRAGVDSSMASAEYAKAKLLLLESERREKSERYKLNTLIGLSSEPVEALDSMLFFNELPTQGTQQIALESNPVLRLYQARIESTQARSTALKRSFLPSLSLVGSTWARGSGVSRINDSYQTDFSNGTRYQVYNYLAGVSARWVISDIFSSHQKFKAEQSRLTRDQELYNEQSLRINQQTKDADLAHAIALEQARLAPKQVLAAQQACAQATARYKNGLTDLPTMLQTMVVLTRAEADLAIAYSNVWRTLLAQAASRGDIQYFIQAIKQ